MEIRAIAPNEWKYTYAQSTQLEGQTGVIGHLRGDFASSGYGFYTTWLIPDRSGNLMSLRQSLTRLSIRFVRTRDFCTTATI